MNLKKMNREELLKMKFDIEEQLNFVDSIKTEIKVSSEKNCLSDLKKNDKIFVINFRDGKIYHMDYVKINFSKSERDEYFNFSTEHDTKPMGCSSVVSGECMSNHYFLSEFCSNIFYFFTLKPESWKDDLKSEIARLSKRKKEIFNKELKSFKTNVSALIQNNEVDDLIKNCL